MKLSTLAAALVAVHMVNVLAATDAPESPAHLADGIRHVVAKGDTLYGVARQYLPSTAMWPALQRHNAIRDPLRLQPGQVVFIPASLLAAEPVTATVDFVHGNVQAAAGPKVPSVPVAAGSQLVEGTQLQTGGDGYVSVRLADGSLIKVQAGSDVTLERMRRRTVTGDTSLGIGLQRGSVQSTVTPKNTRGQRFDIRTPLAVASVRGTEFDVSVADNGNTATSVTQGVVAVRAPAHAREKPEQGAPGAELQAGEGNAVTRDGSLGKTTQLLPAPDLSTLPALLDDAESATFNVPALPQAATYRVRIAQDEALVQVVRNASFPSAQFRFDGLPDGHYFVGVRGVDASGITGKEAHAALTVKVLPTPPPPFYQSPTGGAQVSSAQVALLCTGVPGVQWFHIQVAGSEDFSNPVVNESRLSVCEYTTQQLAPGKWYWRVASVGRRENGQALPGPFATPQTFTVPPAAPAFFNTSDPAAGGKVFWDAQAGHTYRIQVARDENFAHFIADQAVAQAAWDFAGVPPGKYYMRVQAIDSQGTAGTFSGARQIDTRAMLRSSDGVAVQASDGELVTRP